MSLNPSNPPERRALSDEELQARVYRLAEEQGAATAIAFLEEQARLRELDELELAKWQLDNPPVYQPVVETPQLASVAPYEVISADEEATVDELAKQRESTAQITGTESPDAAHSLASSEILSATESSAAENAPVVMEASVPHREPSPVLSEAVFALSPSAGAEIVIDEDYQLESELEHSSQISASQVNFANFDLSEVEQANQKRNPVRLSDQATTGRQSAVSLFWVWASVFMVGAPALALSGLSSQGFSKQESLLATIIGFFGAGLAISVVSIAGKRSGLSTLVISRAAFGYYGNLLPAVLTVLGKIMLSLVLGFVLLSTVNDLNANQGFVGLVTLAVILLVVSLIAGFGGEVLYRFQQVVSIAALALLMWIVAQGYMDQVVSALPSDINPIRVLSAAALVFAVFGLLLASSAGEYTRQMSVQVRGSSVTLWVLLAVFISGSLGASILTYFSVETGWLSLIALILGITVLLTSNQYSTSRSFSAFGWNAKPAISQPLLALLVLGASFALHSQTDISSGLALDFLAFAAVPISGWAGIFISDVLIRRIAYHEISLSRSYGFYKAVNWVNLGGLVVASAVGFGLADSDMPFLNWQGYLLIGVPNPDFWASGNMAILTTFSLGILLPLIFGIPRIKRQEAEVLAIEARRSELLDVLGLVE